MPLEYQMCLDDIKLTHRAVPLPVFVGSKPIGIHDTSDVLHGAVIELQFELLHFPIAQKNLDSFNASIQQIQVLRPGESRPATAFKRQNLDEGPINVTESDPLRNIDAPSAEKRPHTSDTEKGSFPLFIA